MSYDEEAIYQDADIEMAEYAREARAARAAEERGRCLHNSAVGYRNPIVYPEQEGLEPGQLRCHGCATVFADDEDWADARQEAIYG